MGEEQKPKRHSFQEIKKRVYGRCLFCGEGNYDLLDTHRIEYGEDGGKYSNFNCVVACVRCHRLIHSGEIVVDRKYKTSRAVDMVHYWRGGVEIWEYEDRA